MIESKIIKQRFSYPLFGAFLMCMPSQQAMAQNESVMVNMHPKWFAAHVTAMQDLFSISVIGQLRKDRLISRKFERQVYNIDVKINAEIQKLFKGEKCDAEKLASLFKKYKEQMRIAKSIIDLVKGPYSPRAAVTSAENLLTYQQGIMRYYCK